MMEYERIHLEIVEVPTDELAEYSGNAKLHPAEQIDQITESIREFGFSTPILAWHDENGRAEIVAGHGRLIAAKRLGLESLPVVFLDHMSEEQRRAYNLIDNQLTMNSGFDLDALAEEIAKISTIDMGEYGFADAVEIEFEDFDGEGDGGGSRMGNGSGCRVVIGSQIGDIKEDGNECFRRSQKLDIQRMLEFVHDALMSGELA